MRVTHFELRGAMRYTLAPVRWGLLIGLIASATLFAQTRATCPASCLSPETLHRLEMPEQVALRVTCDGAHIGLQLTVARHTLQREVTQTPANCAAIPDLVDVLLQSQQLKRVAPRGAPAAPRAEPIAPEAQPERSEPTGARPEVRPVPTPLVERSSAERDPPSVAPATPQAGVVATELSPPVVSPSETQRPEVVAPTELADSLSSRRPWLLWAGAGLEWVHLLPQAEVGGAVGLGRQVLVGLHGALLPAATVSVGGVTVVTWRQSIMASLAVGLPSTPGAGARLRLLAGAEQVAAQGQGFDTNRFDRGIGFVGRVEGGWAFVLPLGLQLYPSVGVTVRPVAWQLNSAAQILWPAVEGSASLTLEFNAAHFSGFSAQP